VLLEKGSPTESAAVARCGETASGRNDCVGRRGEMSDEAWLGAPSCVRSIWRASARSCSASEIHLPTFFPLAGGSEIVALMNSPLLLNGRFIARADRICSDALICSDFPISVWTSIDGARTCLRVAHSALHWSQIDFLNRSYRIKSDIKLNRHRFSCTLAAIG
jgi:hypothetical protein